MADWEDEDVLGRRFSGDTNSVNYSAGGEDGRRNNHNGGYNDGFGADGGDDADRPENRHGDGFTRGKRDEEYGDVRHGSETGSYNRGAKHGSQEGNEDEHSGSDSRRGGRYGQDNATNNSPNNEVIIPTSFDKRTVEQFLGTLKLMDYKTPVASMSVLEYLTQAYKVHINKEVNTFEATLKKLSKSSKNPISNENLRKQVNGFLEKTDTNNRSFCNSYTIRTLQKTKETLVDEVVADTRTTSVQNVELTQNRYDEFIDIRDFPELKASDGSDRGTGSNISNFLARSKFVTSTRLRRQHLETTTATSTNNITVATNTNTASKKVAANNVCGAQPESLEMAPAMINAPHPYYSKYYTEEYLYLREPQPIILPTPIEPDKSKEEIPEKSEFYCRPFNWYLFEHGIYSIGGTRPDTDFVAFENEIEDHYRRIGKNHRQLVNEPAVAAAAAATAVASVASVAAAADSNFSSDYSNINVPRPMQISDRELDIINIAAINDITAGQSAVAQFPDSSDNVRTTTDSGSELLPEGIVTSDIALQSKPETNSLPPLDVSSLSVAINTSGIAANAIAAVTTTADPNSNNTPTQSTALLSTSSGSTGCMQRSFLRRQNLESIYEEEEFHRSLALNQVSTPLTAHQLLHPEADTNITQRSRPIAELMGPIREEPELTIMESSMPIALNEEITTSVGRPEQPALVMNTTDQQITRDDDYRRDWFEILRRRQTEMNYAPLTAAKRKRRRKRQRHVTSIVESQLIESITEPEQVLAAVIPPRVFHETEQQGAHILQTEITPELALTLPPNDTRNNNTEVQSMQEEYDEFLISNEKDISFLINNSSTARNILLEHNSQLIQQQRSSFNIVTSNYPTLPATYTFDPNLLLNENPVILKIKLAVLQALICFPKCNLSRADFIQNRMEASIAFKFLLELEGANIINLNQNNGEFSLRNEGHGGNNFKRNRDGNRESNYSARSSGGRNPNEHDDNDDVNEDGVKKREFYIPPEPPTDETEIFASGIARGMNFNNYDSIPVKVSGEKCPSPVKSFDQANLRSIILDNVQKSGYTVPTPIQKVSLPVISNGRDLMACAQTGSGKTAAFLLPILSYILEEGRELIIGRPHALIITPTRELAVQIYNEALKFAYSSYLKISVVYGGTSFRYQNDNVCKGCHVLIGTPGRLLDFLRRAFISFEDTRFVVLDEADRMLDMGFIDNVKIMVNHETMSKDRQTLMFSATFPEDIQRLASEFLVNYIFVAIGIVGGACSDVKQDILEVTKFNKRSKLLEILRDDAEGTIVFVETKRGADFLASFFSETEFPTTSIHGDRLQSQRETALRDFKSGKMKVLIATSVASRGLDIKNVKHVINFDMPTSIDDYVHRIGRTGRVGNCGHATSFFDPDSDGAIVPDLIRILEGSGQEVPDFLRSPNFSYYSGSARHNQFGGVDVRGKSASDEANEVEEVWD